MRVLTHFSPAHRGVSASRNLGIHASSGELIAFLDADDVVLPNRFKTSVAMLREQPHVDGIYELTRIANRSQQGKNGLVQWRDGSIFGVDAPLYGKDLFRKLMTGIPWHGNAFLCRRTLFDRIGTFDEGRTMAEDCHLWIRAAAAAVILPADPLNVVCLYVRHATNSYQYSLERRLDLLDAMADAGLWIKRNALPQWGLWQSCFAAYLCRSIIAAREANNFRILWKEVRLCLHYRLHSVLFSSRVMMQLVAAIRSYSKSNFLAIR